MDDDRCALDEDNFLNPWREALSKEEEKNKNNNNNQIPWDLGLLQKGTRHSVCHFGSHS